MISFIVPAWNEESTLSNTLQSIHAAAFGTGVEYEIIVADDASDDGTVEVARRNGARVESNYRRQIAGTRNAGAKASRGAILIFVDADTCISSELLRATLRALDGGAVGGGCAVEFDYVPAWAKRALPVFAWLYGKSGMAAGCYVFCRREAFDKIGGFDERFFAGEECVLSTRIRKHGPFVVLHEKVLTSGRKLRLFSPRQYATFLFNLCIHLPFRRNHKGMELWYGAGAREPRVDNQGGS